MSWVKLDDGFAEHPKVIAAGPLAGWVHVCGLCYCNRNLTDGYVPGAVAKRLADFEHVGLEIGGVSGMVAAGVDVDCQMLVDILVEVGMWEQVAGGYLIHDYLDYNPSKAMAIARRADISKARSEAGKKGAEARWDGKRMANGWQSDDIEGEWQTDGPEPVPEPVSTQQAEESTKGKGSSSIEDRNDLPFDLQLARAKLLSELGASETGSLPALERFGLPPAAWFAAAEELHRIKDIRNRAAYAVSLFKAWKEEGRYA